MKSISSNTTDREEVHLQFAHKLVHHTASGLRREHDDGGVVVVVVNRPPLAHCGGWNREHQRGYESLIMGCKPRASSGVLRALFLAHLARLASAVSL